MTINELSKVDEYVTHSGPFHADDVVSAILIELMLNRSITFRRVKSLDEGVTHAFVFDIGGGMFDHHNNGATQSACMLIWNHFGIQWLKSRGLSDAIALRASAKVREFLTPVSYVDLNGPSVDTPSSISSMIRAMSARFQNMWDEGFSMAIGCFKAPIQAIVENAIESAKLEVKAEEIAIRSIGIVDLTEESVYIPAYLFKKFSNLRYTLSKSPRGGFNLQCINGTVEELDLTKATFHNAFMASYATKEDALAAL